MMAGITCALCLHSPLSATTYRTNATHTMHEAAFALRNKQYQHAHRLYTDIANQQANPDALFTLGLMAEKGWDNGKPHALRACNWYRLAAHQEHGQAMEKLGHCYRAGVLRAAGQSAASKNAETQTPAYWYSRSAAKGNTQALCHLGELHRLGQGVERNSARALQLCFEAARGGSTWAQRVVGQHFAQQSHFDFAQAAYWYQQAAVNGDGQAAYALAELYHSNPKIVAERFQWQSANGATLARDWYEVAAGLGVKSAYAKTGILYYQALNSALKNPSRQSGMAAKLLAKSYIWLRASHAAHTPNSPDHKASQHDQAISKNMRSKLRSILPLMPKDWVPALEDKIITHFEKHPLSWQRDPRRLPTAKTQVAQY